MAQRRSAFPLILLVAFASGAILCGCSDTEPEQVALAPPPTSPPGTNGVVPDAPAGEPAATATMTPVPEPTATPTPDLIRITGRLIAPADVTFVTGELVWKKRPRQRDWWKEPESAVDGKEKVTGSTFEFGVPVTGKYDLRIVSDGIAELVYGVTVEADRNDHELELRAGGLIAGRVTEEGSGKPVTNANVRVNLERGAAAELRKGVRFGGASAKTDDNGEYRLTRALVDSPHRANVNVETHHGTATGDIRPPTDELNFTLKPGGSISGTVRSATDGRLLEGIAVRAFFGWQQKANSKSDKDGLFRLGPFGDGEVRIMANGAGLVSHRRIQEGIAMQTASDKHVEGVTIDMHPGGAIEVTVIGPNREPVEDVDIRAHVSHRFDAGEFEGRTYHGENSERARTGEDGTAQVSGLWDGEWQVRTRHPDYVAGAPHTNKVTVLNGSLERIEIRLKAGRTVSGHVVNASGEALQDVVVRAEMVIAPNGNPLHTTDLS